jgi:hypothetical protein
MAGVQHMSCGAAGCDPKQLQVVPDEDLGLPVPVTRDPSVHHPVVAEVDGVAGLA